MLFAINSAYLFGLTNWNNSKWNWTTIIFFRVYFDQFVSCEKISEWVSLVVLGHGYDAFDTPPSQQVI